MSVNCSQVPIAVRFAMSEDAPVFSAVMCMLLALASRLIVPLELWSNWLGLFGVLSLVTHGRREYSCRVLGGGRADAQVAAESRLGWIGVPGHGIVS